VPKTIKIPGTSAWWPYRDSNPSFSPGSYVVSTMAVPRFVAAFPPAVCISVPRREDVVPVPERISGPEAHRRSANSDPGVPGVHGRLPCPREPRVGLDRILLGISAVIRPRGLRLTTGGVGGQHRGETTG
jgi:hypothetical protein